MKGHIKQRSKGSWTIWVDLGRDPETRKRKQQTLTVHGAKRDAERELRDLLHSLEAGSYIKPNRITLGQWLEQWCQSYVAMHCSSRTADSASRQLLQEYLDGILEEAEQQPQWSALESATAQLMQGEKQKRLNDIANKVSSALDGIERMRAFPGHCHLCPV